MQACVARETDHQPIIAQCGLNSSHAECQEARLGKGMQAGAFRDGCLEEAQERRQTRRLRSQGFKGGGEAASSATPSLHLPLHSQGRQGPRMKAAWLLRSSCGVRRVGSHPRLAILLCSPGLATPPLDGSVSSSLKRNDGANFGSTV